VAPLSSQRYGVQLSVGQRAYDKLRYVQALLGHHVPAEELEAVFESGLDAYTERLEKQKLAKTSRPRRQRGSSDPDYIPVEVRRVVWERDGGRCTFVGGNGRRCAACTDLNLDPIIPRARGGKATVDNVRLLCRAHNQFEAERMFGAGFMEMKREAALAAAAERRAVAEEKRMKAEAERAEKRARAEAERAAAAAQAEAEKDPERSVVPWLLRLRVSLAEARRVAGLCEHMAEAPLEERIRFALRQLAPPRSVERVPAMAT
jgi:5-methylcytosine-specific restriction endonuclease McrA